MKARISHSSRAELARLFVAVLLLPLLCALFLTRLGDLSNYHGDESLWLTVSNKLFRLYALNHRFDDPAWRKEYSTFGSRQPQIGKYVIGLGTSTVDFTGEPEQYSWRWDQSQEWNMAHRLPPILVVERGRFAVAAMGVIATLAFYWLTALVTNLWCGLIAVASLLGARLLLESSRRAMIDAPALAFGLLTLVAMVYLLRSLRGERHWAALGWAALAGCLAGLAVGTKLHGLLIMAVCLAALAWEAARGVFVQPRRAYAALLCMAILLLGAWAVFYLSNPLLYGAPLAGVRHLLELNDMIATIPFQPLRTLPERTLAVWNSLSLYAPLGRLGLPYDRWLTLLGAAALVIAVWQAATRPGAAELDLLLLWIVISYAGITLWLPHDWERYYLPLQPCNALLQAYGLWSLATQIVSAWRARRQLGAVPHGVP